MPIIYKFFYKFVSTKYIAMISKTIKNLRDNNFEVFFAEDIINANEIFKDIISSLNFTTVSYGDSMTMKTTESLNILKNMENVEFIETFDKNYSQEEKISKRKMALTADLFITGTNAITEFGQLVNLDMVGNRIGGINFGPKNVILFVGVNKIVKDLTEAFIRIKTISAPLNAKLHTNLITPCQKNGECVECSCDDRLCNSWLITEKSFPKHRIKIILINKELGL